MALQTRGFGVDVMPHYTPVDPNLVAADPSAIGRGAAQGMDLVSQFQKIRAMRAAQEELEATRQARIAAENAKNTKTGAYDTAATANAELAARADRAGYGFREARDLAHTGIQGDVAGAERAKALLEIARGTAFAPMQGRFAQSQGLIADAAGQRAMPEAEAAIEEARLKGFVAKNTDRNLAAEVVNRRAEADATKADYDTQATVGNLMNLEGRIESERLKNLVFPEMQALEMQDLRLKPTATQARIDLMKAQAGKTSAEAEREKIGGFRGSDVTSQVQLGRTLATTPVYDPNAKEMVLPSAYQNRVWERVPGTNGPLDPGVLKKSFSFLGFGGNPRINDVASDEALQGAREAFARANSMSQRLSGMVAPTAPTVAAPTADSEAVQWAKANANSTKQDLREKAKKILDLNGVTP